MPPKRPRDKDSVPEGPSAPPTVGQLTSHIRNKQVRGEKYAQLKAKKQKAKKTARLKRQKEEDKAEELGVAPPPRKVPKEILPHAEYYKRNGFPLKKIVSFASNQGFTDLMVFNEDKKSINGLLLVHLPDGPTAHFKLTNLVLGRDIKGHGRATEHKAELILNNFDTRIGRRLGRMLASCFSQDPTFRGRRVATFHNQRDFVFFRHHRYIFEQKEKKATSGGKQGPVNNVNARLQELGPRFTLKLKSLQKGTFDAKYGEFEWVPKKDKEATRRRFLL